MRMATFIGASLLLAANAASASITEITFAGQISPGNAGCCDAAGFNLAANTTAAQRAYLDGFEVFNITPGSSYSFTFRYDSATPNDDPFGGVSYPISLVSGFAGSNLDFTGWVPRVRIVDVSANRFVSFELIRTEVFRNVNVTSFAVFSMFAGRTSGLINFSPLPDGPFPQAVADTATAQFGIFGTEGHRRSLSDLSPGGVTQAAFPPGGGAVPEPASWAMLVAGFGLIGAVRRRRRSPPATA